MQGRLSRTKMLLAIGLLLVLLLPGVAHATFPGANGKIAFVRGGNIWVMNPGGSGQVRLTWGGTADHPRWSADGTKIAFDWNGDVWVMRANGTGKYRVTKHAAYEIEPAWSPDGRWLVFSSNRRGWWEIFKIRSTVPFGTPVRLTDNVGTGEGDMYENPYQADSAPNWSPLGTKIAFSRYFLSEPEHFAGWAKGLVTMNPDGSGLVERGGEYGSRAPNWGPGGNRIAWTDSILDYDQMSDNIWHSAPDGSSPVKVTHYTEDSPWSLGTVSWSPVKGKLIVYSGLDQALASTPAVYKVRSSGLYPPVLIARNAENPDWGPTPT